MSKSLRIHLGLDRMDLLAHSAGAFLATLYAAAYPQRLSRLILVTPGLAAVGAEGTRTSSSPLSNAGRPSPGIRRPAPRWRRSSPGTCRSRLSAPPGPSIYGRWDEAARAHATVGVSERHQAAREGYFADVVLDPPATRAALKKLTAPVLLYAGELDPMVTPAVVRAAAPGIQRRDRCRPARASHFPWVDGPAAFAAAVGSFLG